MRQGSYEWRVARLGMVTASEFGRLWTEAGRRGYAAKLRHEREMLERHVADGEELVVGPDFESRSTEWGKTTEPLARAEWELRHDADLEVPAFVFHSDLEFVGCSPDGLAIPGGVEIKCPYVEGNHQRTLVAGMDDDHVPQVQGVIWVCGLEWLDFVSYDPRAPLHMQYYEQRVYRDDRYIAALADRVARFWRYVVDGDYEPVTDGRTIPTIF